MDQNSKQWLKNEVNGSTHGRNCSLNGFQQSPSRTVNEHCYRDIFVDLISVVLPLVVEDAL